MFRLTATAIPAAFLLAPLTVMPAAAQCVQAGPTIACTGTETNEIDADIDGLTVLVPLGATVDIADDDAIRLRGDDNTLIVDGTVQTFGNGDEAVQADGENFTLTNTGTIFSDDDKGVQAEEFGTTITNSGSIAAATEGVEAGNGVTILNLTGGSISAGEDAVQFGGGTLFNAPGATITGGDTGAEGDGLDIDFGSVVNMGTIEALGPDSAAIDVDEVDIDDNPITAVLTITNTGTLSGATGILVEPDLNGGPNESRQIVTNSGTISAFDGVAMSLAAGDDFVSLENGSSITGSILLGAGNDFLGLSRAVSVSAGSILDGGDGAMDVLGFGNAILPTDVSFTALGGSAFDLAFDGAVFAVSGFERLQFGSNTFALEESGSIAPVPLPAGMLMLVTALGGLILTRRRATA
jgi:hypothetical protein